MEVVVVGDGDQGVEIFPGELVLEEGEVGGGVVGEGGELGDEGGELDVAVDGEDLGVAGDVGEVVVVGAGLDAAAEAAHELDLGRGVVQGRLAAVVVVVVVVVGVGVAGARGGVAGIHRGGARVSEGIGEMNLKRVCGSGLSGVVVGRVWVYILW